jgi:hypothetical protein
MAGTKKAAIYFINGEVCINGDDVATISEVDNSVLLKLVEDQKEFSGSHIAPIEVHTTSVKATLKISKAVFKKDMLAKVVGMNSETGTLSDGATQATVSKITLNNHWQRPVVPILIKGKDDTTGLAIEIAAEKAVCTSDFELNLSKDDFTQEELEFLILGDADNLDNSLFEVRLAD